MGFVNTDKLSKLDSYRNDVLEVESIPLRCYELFLHLYDHMNVSHCDELKV